MIQHRKILKSHGVEFFENWKPVPKYTSDGTDVQKKDDNEDDDGEDNENKKQVEKKGNKGQKQFGSTMPLQRNMSLPLLQDPKQQQKDVANRKVKQKVRSSKQEMDAFIFN